jgi:hypothetical protein
VNRRIVNYDVGDGAEKQKELTQRAQRREHKVHGGAWSMLSTCAVERGRNVPPTDLWDDDARLLALQFLDFGKLAAQEFDVAARTRTAVRPQ